MFSFYLNISFSVFLELSDSLAWLIAIEWIAILKEKDPYFIFYNFYQGTTCRSKYKWFISIIGLLLTVGGREPMQKLEINYPYFMFSYFLGKCLDLVVELWKDDNKIRTVVGNEQFLFDRIIPDSYKRLILFLWAVKVEIFKF